MAFRFKPQDQLALGLHALRWLAIAAVLGGLIGSAVALFLWSLDLATTTRWNHPALLYFLPLAGIAVALLYQAWGKSVEAGNNLIVDEIHAPGGGVPARMGPLVLIGTVITHLFGGSAGREGTAVQMGGSLASWLARLLRLNSNDVRILLMAGVAGGFGAVFGTPLTGAIFAMEVLAIGKMSYESMIPCLVAAIVGDQTTKAWGLEHSVYRVSSMLHAAVTPDAMRLDWLLAGKVAVAAVAFGLVALLFAELTHGLHALQLRWIKHAWLRAAVGALLVILLVWLLGTRDYLGLGVSADPHTPGAVTIQSCFHADGATSWSWWWKLLFTAITLSAGFKGGEVTPLFFIGAALGNTIAQVCGAPVDLFAALGFVAVFGAATNTPLACTIMGIELFGASGPGLFESGFVVYLAIACFVAYLMSGHSGIYLSQQIGTPKHHSLAGDDSLRAARQKKGSAAAETSNQRRKRRREKKSDGPK